MVKKLKTSKMKVGKYNIGLPGSDSYKAKTPNTIKTIGEGCILVGSLVTIIAASLTPPGWVLVMGGGATLLGRFFVKCFSE